MKCRNGTRSTSDRADALRSPWRFQCQRIGDLILDLCEGRGRAIGDHDHAVARARSGIIASTVCHLGSRAVPHGQAILVDETNPRRRIEPRLSGSILYVPVAADSAWRDTDRELLDGSLADPGNRDRPIDPWLKPGSASASIPASSPVTGQVSCNLARSRSGWREARPVE